MGPFSAWFGIICGFTFSHLTICIVCVCCLGGGETRQYRGAYETFRGTAGGEEPGTAQGQLHFISLKNTFFWNCILPYYALFLQYALCRMYVSFLYEISKLPPMFAKISSIKQHSAWKTVSHNAVHSTLTFHFQYDEETGSKINYDYCLLLTDYFIELPKIRNILFFNFLYIPGQHLLN